MNLRDKVAVGLGAVGAAVITAVVVQAEVTTLCSTSSNIQSVAYLVGAPASEVRE